jgi:MarR family transcriptional regulator, negative regulator of the multidrug operon emrRAB
MNVFAMNVLFHGMSTPMSDPRLVNRLHAAALVIDDAVRTRVAEAAPLPGGDVEALRSLVNFADGRRIEELRAALGLSQPGGAHLVSRLEAAGLARRRRDPHDRRGVLVSLTPRGRRMARTVAEAREAAVRESLGVLDEREQAALLRVLDDVLRRATHSRQDARRVCRLCDGDACGHPDDCPVTLRADEIDAGR